MEALAVARFVRRSWQKLRQAAPTLPRWSGYMPSPEPAASNGRPSRAFARRSGLRSSSCVGGIGRVGGVGLPLSLSVPPVRLNLIYNGPF